MNARSESERDPADRSAWRATLNELGVRPSKALGQNFLHDPAIVRRIADAARLSSSDTVVEVGPGLGILTRELANRAGRIIAIELDRRLAAYLQANAPPNVTIVAADILEADVPTLVQDQPYVVVANLPYSVASAAIERLLESTQPPIRLVVMVQREVAERIVARPPHMSVLSVAVQFFGTPRIVFRIGPGAFIPPPKVDSAVLEIDVRSTPLLDATARKRFFTVVRAGFGQRRKQLANSLSRGLGLPRAQVEKSLRAAEVEPSRRAETLTLDEWLRLHHALEAA